MPCTLEPGMIIATTDTPRLFRRADGKLVAGVASGLADHLGLNVLAVRIGFVVLTFFSGLGIVLYAASWAIVPQPPADEQPAAPAKRRGELGVQLVAFAAIAIGLLLVVQQTNLTGRSELVWPVAVALFGAALIWRQADEAQRVSWQRMMGATDPGRRVAALRIVLGALLVLVGLASVLAVSGNLASVRDGIAATAVILAGVAVVTGPWWWRTWTDLSTERRERIRSQERAEVAAHVHDSVLHTLALIQRRVDDPREVARLARGQERELRSWLYKPTGSPDERLAAAREAAAAEVEDTYAVSVEPVVVGDCAVDERLAALVQAAREALINAAK
ncbi:MAG: PspC domain-containing protein, partial [Mycobacteriales bacterium]